MSYYLSKFYFYAILILRSVFVIGAILVGSKILSVIYGSSIQFMGILAILAYVLFILANLEIYNLSNRRNKTVVDEMSGLEFEEFLGGVLKHAGFTNIVLTEKYDLGVDVIAVKHGIRYGIQAKRYSGLVGIDAVRQVTAALRHYNCTRAVVITNSRFSAPARTLARSNDCMLIDGRLLQELIDGKIVEF